MSKLVVFDAHSLDELIWKSSSALQERREQVIFFNVSTSFDVEKLIESWKPAYGSALPEKVREKAKGSDRYFVLRVSSSGKIKLYHFFTGVACICDSLKFLEKSFHEEDVW